ncbi:hypothetical protein ACN6LL_006917 [Streptomyces violaceoruber]
MMILAVTSPEVVGIPVATLALVVASLSLVVALSALGWQIAKHLLDGGRVKIYLNSAVWEPELRLLVDRSGKWNTTAGTGHIVPENIEIAQLVVENPGRIAITVYSPSLAITGTKNKDYTVAPRALSLKHFDADSTAPQYPIRIDPYDRVTFALDYWSIIPRLLAEADGSHIEIRGCISRAGASQPRKSSKRLAWRIPQGAWTSRTDIQKISPYTVLWREFFKANEASIRGSESEDATPKFILDGILRSAMQKFDERPTSMTFLLH